MGSNQPNRRPTELRIDVDVRQALKVLSENVFAGQQACIRELIANAADSIAQLPPERRGNVEIRILPDCGNGTLTISDNGVGMTREEASTLLGTIFATAKGTLRGMIGQFGIGFYSCFPLCSEVEVFTRTRRPDDSGTRILYMGGQTLSVESVEVSSPGTSVRLHLLDAHRSLLDDDVLRGLVQKDCRFVRYPIYLGNEWTVLNKMDAPWYHDAPERDLRIGLQELLVTPDPLAVFPIHDTVGNGEVWGVLYVVSSREKSRVRVYSHRVLITESDSTLLDESLRAFLSGVIDAEDLPLVISRNAVLEGSAQARSLRGLLVERLGDELEEMATSRRQEFRLLMADHGPAIKAACLEHESLMSKLRNHFPYRSSLRPSATVPEYLSGRPDNTVIYADDMSLGESLLPLYNQANIEVLFMTDAVDHPLRERWLCGGRRIAFKRLDVDPPGPPEPPDSGQEIAVDSSTLEALRMLFRSSVDEEIRVELRVLGPQSPAAILALSEEDRNHLQVAEIVRVYDRQGRLGELPPELQKMARSGFLDLLARMTTRTIILNRSNDLVQLLIRRLRSGGFAAHGQNVEPLIAQFLHGQALLASGLHLSTEKLTEISQIQTRLITRLLEQVSHPK